ncbi:MAG: DUF5622 domain-containing protein [Sulfolobaceae archaeon]|nr:DUF5622 domain-containing protein [Sulfolobaceae archaeon]
MTLKHDKYAFVDLKNGKYVKIRILKSKEENSPDRYLVLNKIYIKKPSRNATILKLEDLPVEVRDKLKNLT